MGAILNNIGRNRLLLAPLLLLLLALLVTAWTLSSYAITTITVTLHDGIEGAPVSHTITHDGDEKEIRKIGKYSFIPRDAGFIRVAVDTFSTLKELPELNRVGITAVPVNLYKDKEASKYTDDSLGCIAFDNKADSLLSYKCGNPEQLVRHDIPTDPLAPWESTQIATLTTVGDSVFAVAPYQGGVLGVHVPKHKPMPMNQSIFTVKANGEKNSLTAPGSLRPQHLGAIGVVTDVVTQDAQHFLLVSKPTGTVYFANTISGSDATYRYISLPEDFSKIFDTISCQLVDLTAYCIYGHGSGPPDSEEDSHYHGEEKAGVLLAIDFSTEEPSVSRYNLTNTMPVDSLSVTRAGDLFVQSDKDLYRISPTGDTASTTLHSTSVNSIAAGESLYFIQNNTLYKTDTTTRESYQLFHSANLRLSNVAAIDDAVFVNAFIEGRGDNKLFTFKISDTPRTQKEPEPPAPPKERPLVAKLPYKNLLYNIDFRTDPKDPTNRSTIIEIDAPEGTREHALAQIERWGYNPIDYNIEFVNYKSPF